MRFISRAMGCSRILNSEWRSQWAFTCGAPSRRRARHPSRISSVLRFGRFFTGGWDRMRFHQRRKMVGSCSGAEATALNSRE
jgi:hypothetical protein